ncbi:hypothetical protein KXW98_006656 [Aspergillus fumigatus]|uniref:Rhodopsin domain-containing protein n=1 Tax=Aspergillus fumigatus TaxID=746128 RepID=A0A8H4HJY9_ASPFM|nr:hypothetical protein CNMCM8057_006995 [Aspergillus fumigatus]KMK55406.1 hypothetical protein Y699_07511 [Aspergillus fumigatus Z5]KAF4255871.1 hypothetical protein CNMCM8812_007430 [Aspergillus fumigatus]KAF4276817.1 hypothetical protein CNMCM8689_005548 [Aspergillus fumigatus]KAF4282509.1 hypothetical protein CNMCM8686_006350 [Aspergillus fumigatus]
MGDSFTNEAFTLLSLAIVVIILRIVARIMTVGLHNFQLDDYLMPLAGVVYGLETGAAYCVGAWWKGLANNHMTDDQRAALSPDSEEFRLRVGGSKTQVLGWSLYTTLLWLLKACMAIFYSRLTAGLINMHIRVRVAYGAIGVTYLIVILSILFGCHPMHKNWQIYPNPGLRCQPAIAPLDVYMTVTLNVATDIYLITIPTPMLFKARLPWREKLELFILFSGGIFVMAAGILRCVLIVTAGANGASQAGSWACRETFVAVVIGNAPMIYPLFRRAARRAGWYISSRGHSQSYPAYPLSEGERGENSTHHSKKRRFRHPLSIPDTHWHTINDEAMILPTSRQQPPTCTASPPRDWDALSQPSADGIKVVHEMIIERNER